MVEMMDPGINITTLFFGSPQVLRLKVSMLDSS